MQFRELGDSGIKVSEICLGSWLTYGVGVDDSAGRECLDAAFDAGINFIDTANVYGRGAAESFLGNALNGRPRDSYVLATKLFFPMSDSDKGLSRAQIEKQIDASLKRLETDYVDLYQCHRFDPDTPLEETMAALSDVVRSGKARAIGFSEWAPDEIAAALAMAPPHVKFVSSQPQYSLLYRRPEAKVIPLCVANGIGQIVWSPLAMGVLSGKYAPGTAPPTDSRAASEDQHFMQRYLADDVLTAIQSLRPIAEQAGCTMAQLAIAWLLAQPGMTSVIVGASRAAQVHDNAAASGLTIDPALLTQAATILEGVRIT